MITNRKLQRAVHIALSVASGALVTSYAPSAIAQAQEDASADRVEGVTVTGSRIKRPNIESASPITVIDHASIVDAGITDIGNLIQRMPSMSGSPIGTTTNNGGNGSVQVDIRGMGVDRTVTLINGKRTVDGGDYQTIPTTMIERVEVLKDGASAVYGADAVAGVVNIITRRDFEGLEVNLQTADFFDMDSGSQSTAGFIAGKAFDTGHFVFGAEYVDQEEAFQRDAPWAFFQDSFYIYPEGCENQVTAPYDGTPQGGCYRLGSSRIIEGRLAFPTVAQGGLGQGQFMNVDGSGIVPFDGRTYNFAPVNYIQTPFKRTNLFAEGGFDLTDTVRFNASFRGNFRESAQELAPTPYDSGPFLDPGFIVAVDADGDAINGISGDNYYLVQAATAAGLTPEPVFRARRRMHEQTRRFTQDVTQYQADAGFSGDFNDNLDWEVSYNRGYRSRTDRDFGQYAGARLANALGPSADLNGDGQPECYTNIADPTTLVPGCVPLNLFGGPGSVTPAMYDYINVNLTDHFQYLQDEANASISGRAFNLPGGQLGWAVGYAYIENSLQYSPDSGKDSGDVTGNTGGGTDGNLIANSFYVELLAPVFDNGSQSLELKASGRLDDYTAFKEETTWQAGIEFHAFKDLKLRGTAGTVFRAPTIDNLFQSQIDNFPTFNDPCVGTPAAGCAQASQQPDQQVLTIIGGNPNLIPETGDTLTVGVVWTPTFGNGGLSTTVDYWKIDIEDGISSLGIQYILDDCYVSLNAQSCSQISRDAAYEVTQVIDPTLNVAEQGAEGIDTEVRYTFDTRVGKFEAGVLWSHLLERTKVPIAGAPEIDLSGRYTDITAEDGGAYAEDKINYSFKWYWRDLLLGYQGEYISSLAADTFCNCGVGNNPDGSYTQQIESFLFHDFLASYEFTKTGTKIAAGVTNFTDEEPPFMEIGFNAGTDPATYRQFGMGYYLRLSQSFK